MKRSILILVGIVYCLMSPSSVSCDYDPETYDYYESSTEDSSPKVEAYYDSSESIENNLDLVFGQLNSSICYYFTYINKYIPRVSRIYRPDRVCLIKLKLSYNQISMIDKDAFSFAIKMEEIDLKSNELTSLEFLQADWACSLNRVYVSDNLLSFINSNWFKCPSNLTTIDLSK